MSCDDKCSFKLNVADPLEPSTATQILWNEDWTHYRNTDIEDKSATSSLYGVRFSEWFSLTQDEYYFVESTLLQGEGKLNINVGMEIIPDVMPAEHSRFERMVQNLSLGQTNIQMDTLEITVLAVD